MTSPAEVYALEKAKRGVTMPRAVAAPKPFSVYLTDLHAKRKNRRPLENIGRKERDAVWAKWYRTMTCEEIAERWTQEMGEACYGEKVRRSLQRSGITLRPRGHRHGNDWTLRNRVAVLEQQVASLVATLLQQEVA